MFILNSPDMFVMSVMFFPLLLSLAQKKPAVYGGLVLRMVILCGRCVSNRRLAFQ